MKEKRFYIRGRQKIFNFCGVLFVCSKIGSLYVTHMAWHSLCKPDWPQTKRGSSASASQVLELKACTTTPGPVFHF